MGILRHTHASTTGPFLLYESVFSLSLPSIPSLILIEWLAGFHSYILEVLLSHISSVCPVSL